MWSSLTELGRGEIVQHAFFGDARVDQDDGVNEMFGAEVEPAVLEEWIVSGLRQTIG
jgi:hypothetical protein